MEYKFGDEIELTDLQKSILQPLHDEMHGMDIMLKKISIMIKNSQETFWKLIDDFCPEAKKYRVQAIKNESGFILRIIGDNDETDRP